MSSRRPLVSLPPLLRQPIQLRIGVCPRFSLDCPCRLKKHECVHESPPSHGDADDDVVAPCWTIVAGAHQGASWKESIDTLHPRFPYIIHTNAFGASLMIQDEPKGELPLDPLGPAIWWVQSD